MPEKEKKGTKRRSKKLLPIQISIKTIYLSKLELTNIGGPAKGVRFQTSISVEGGRLLDENEHGAIATIKVQPENETNTPYIIEAKLNIIYRRQSEDVTEKVLADYAQANALRHIWPYLRELIADSSIRMGYPPLYIPLDSGSEGPP